jgi:hypothetical protein
MARNECFGVGVVHRGWWLKWLSPGQGLSGEVALSEVLREN